MKDLAILAVGGIVGHYAAAAVARTAASEYGDDTIQAAGIRTAVGVAAAIGASMVKGSAARRALQGAAVGAIVGGVTPYTSALVGNSTLPDSVKAILGQVTPGGMTPQMRAAYMLERRQPFSLISGVRRSAALAGVTRSRSGLAGVHYAGAPVLRIGQRAGRPERGHAAF
jgi:hypothetical protein